MEICLVMKVLEFRKANHHVLFWEGWDNEDAHIGEILSCQSRE